MTRKSPLDDYWVFPCSKTVRCQCGAKVHTTHTFRMAKSLVDKEEARTLMRQEAEEWKARPELCKACRTEAGAES